MPITALHFQNVPLSGYIDDCSTKRNTLSISQGNIHKVIHYFKLGFMVNFKKSQIVPTQKIRNLAFVIDLLKMIVTLTEEKKQTLKFHF